MQYYCIFKWIAKTNFKVCGWDIKNMQFEITFQNQLVKNCNTNEGTKLESRLKTCSFNQSSTVLFYLQKRVSIWTTVRVNIFYSKVCRFLPLHN